MALTVAEFPAPVPRGPTAVLPVGMTLGRGVWGCGGRGVVRSTGTSPPRGSKSPEVGTLGGLGEEAGTGSQETELRFSMTARLLD